ncbi:uncharacterized protein C2orf72 homolog [Scleropages formosus]|uniref:uncharacterized protein C2orf72 homolog n=1 Tax=Scleropages formosus TaxID=113540 RepID=UPI0010FA7309|nr:uncharacterized protein C2orf72 homolog [Scleropages formosus]
MAARSRDEQRAEEKQQEEEEEEFEWLLREIGGKERIHLVSDACGGAEDGARGRVLEEFVRVVFPRAPADSQPACDNNVNGLASPQHTRAVEKGDPGSEDVHADADALAKPDSSRASRRARRVARTIDSALVIFVFTREFLTRDRGGLCVKEILKDVRGRLRKGCVPPALLGLVYGAEVPAQPCACLGLLEELLRTLFSRQPPEAIWVGQFAPGTPEVVQAIKRNVCRTVRASLCKGSAVDRKSPFLRMLHCFPWTRRGRYREGPSTHRQPGGPEIAEEDIPLQKTSVPDGEQKDCSISGKYVEDNHHCQST